MGKREDVLRRVQLLLDKAESTTFDAERDSLIAKADALMINYAIESYELDKVRTDSHKAEEVTLKRISFGDSIIRDQLVMLADEVARHNRCKLIVYGSGRGVGFVGFEGDVEYSEMLFTSLRLQLTAKLEPKPDPGLSVEENIIMLLENGQKRERVCELIGWEFKRDHGKVSKIWRKHIEALGQEYKPRARTSHQSYARNFANGYVGQVGLRLFKIREARGDYNKEESSTALVLKDRSQMVDDVFGEMFPSLGTYREQTSSRFDAAARNRGNDAGKQADLGQSRVKQSPALGGAR